MKSLNSLKNLWYKDFLFETSQGQSFVNNIQPYVEILYAIIMNELMSEFKQDKPVGFSVGFDLWSSRSMVHSLLVISYHYMTSDLIMKTLILDAVPFDEKHTAANIAIKLKE